MTLAAPRSWTATRFVALLQSLGRLRIISTSGPSVLEVLCAMGPCSLAGGFLNVQTDEIHWHLALTRFRFLRSYDEIHARSGRRVLFFAMSEGPTDAPFLRIYVHRPPDSEFALDVLARFAEVHRELAAGVGIAAEENQ